MAFTVYPGRHIFTKQRKDIVKCPSCNKEMYYMEDPLRNENYFCTNTKCKENKK